MGDAQARRRAFVALVAWLIRTRTRRSGSELTHTGAQHSDHELGGVPHRPLQVNPPDSIQAEHALVATREVARTPRREYYTSDRRRGTRVGAITAT